MSVHTPVYMNNQLFGCTDDVGDCLYACCCGPCGRVQEVDTIVARERLAYGGCTEVVDRRAADARAPPIQATMVRPAMAPTRHQSASRV